MPIQAPSPHPLRRTQARRAPQRRLAALPGARAPCREAALERAGPRLDVTHPMPAWKHDPWQTAGLHVFLKCCCTLSEHQHV